MLSETDDAAMLIHGKAVLEAEFAGQDFAASAVGAGTFGKVCLATDRSGVKVALKFCREWCGSSTPSDQLVVMQEARRVFSARGPHVVKLLGVFRRLNAPPVLMFIAADNVLSVFLSTRGSLSDHTSRNLSSQLACGMRHLHAQAIVHWDLKPANLLLRYEDTHPTWRLRIADFGSSREVPPASCQTQSVLPSLAKGGLQRLAFPLTPRTGTITHRAPETFPEDAQYGCPADAWSCGSIIYQFITGYPPSRQHRDDDVLKDLVVVLGPCRPQDAREWGLRGLPGVVTANAGSSVP